MMTCKMMTRVLLLLSLPFTLAQNAPIANHDSVSTPIDTPITIGVLENDTGDLLPDSVELVIPPRSGRAAIDAETGDITYSPITGFDGIDTFIYRVCDTRDRCATATVTVTVGTGQGSSVSGRIPGMPPFITVPPAPPEATPLDEAEVEAVVEEEEAAPAVNPLSYRLEHYVVSEVTTADGSRQERFSEASTARPGQIVEYRLFVRNIGDTTLSANTVVITGPVPAGTVYLEGSATPSSNRVLTEYSADGGESFSEAPVMITVTQAGMPYEQDEDGLERRIIAEANRYTAVRWTVLEPTEPGAEVTFFYRVTVQ